MRTYETDITIDDPSRLMLSNNPFQKGEKVHVIIEPAKEAEEKRILRKKEIAARFERLFALAKESPMYGKISEEEIAEEIAAYRRGG